MARIKFPDIKTPERRETADRIIAERGVLLGIYRILLQSPPIASGWLGYLTAIRQKASLAAALRELVILRVAQLNRAAYETHHHIPIALMAGVSQAKLDALDAWKSSLEFDELERAVLRYTDAMTRDVQVSKEVFEAVHRTLGDELTVELTTTIAAYNMVSRVAEALEIHPNDDGPVV